MENKLERLKSRYQELTVALSDPDIYSNQKQFTAFSKEHAELREIISAYEEWQKTGDELSGAQEMMRSESDPDMVEMAELELQELQEKRAELEQQIKMMLVPRDPEDARNAIIEIRAGTGGDEAAIFAGDLFNMYRRYADSKRWNVEIIDSSPAAKGGVKEIVFMLSGTDIFARMKWESGVHRVQRVPETESQGRVHTSAATVAVLPEAEEVDIQINPADLEFEAFRASGAGGQHVNTTDSAVRIRHIPSGIVVGSQEERSQHKNRDKAMMMLRTKLYEVELEAKRAERDANRKNQVSTGDRSAKIRTYNFPQGRMTDHRINYTIYNLDDFMKGDIDGVIDALQLEDNLRKLQDVAEN
ncbi:peptide chain release factor 1 [Cyclonatronum proteinivorum]|uniref:peptide chain release factor 1 n=1 Tax=Cyclonatronum proteinivorum TaxID=1457365 RepID=UPI00197A971D|nr:peptide chain release factor 1 [Cyclonatronum proteinivorum]